MTNQPAIAPALPRYLGALYGGVPAGSLVEVRFRATHGMGRTFHDVRDLGAAASVIARLAAETDVYVGVLPRRRHGGTRDDVVPRARVLWADCDSVESVAALRRLPAQPSIVVSSGSARHLHAYWLLADSVDIVTIANANRRLAAALGADTSCADPARILRPPFPGRNHKRRPPAAVCLLRCEPATRHRLADLLAVLGARHDLGRVGTPRPPRPRATGDPLLTVSPRLYVERLLGQSPGRDGKLTCPFHPDDTPSLHVYAEPERGWYCYGCRRGGSIFDLGSLVFLAGQSEGRELRGDDFRFVRARLLQVFGTDLPDGN